MENMKTCTKCGIEKEAISINFSKDKNRKDGLGRQCKNCINFYNLQLRIKNIDRVPQGSNDIKICPGCKVEKAATLEFFSRDKYTKSGLHSICKTCTKIDKAHYYVKNIEIIKIKKQLCRNIFLRYKSRAAQVNREFSLTFEGFSTFWQKPCTYCNLKIETIGLDRVDSSKGYTLDNVVSCCSVCNYMKRHHSLENFLSHISKIYEHHKNVKKGDNISLNQSQYLDPFEHYRNTALRCPSLMYID